MHFAQKREACLVYSNHRAVMEHRDSISGFQTMLFLNYVNEVTASAMVLHFFLASSAVFCFNHVLHAM